MKVCVLLLLCLTSLEVISGSRRTGGGGSRGGSSSSSRSSSSRSSSGSSHGGSSSSRGGSSSSRGSSTSSRGGSSVSRSSGTSSRGSGSSSRGSSRSSSSRYTPTNYQKTSVANNYGYSKNPTRFNNYGNSGYGYKTSGGQGLSYRSPGYGTNWGTSFGKGSHKIGRNGYSKKALGLGVAAGFVGGAALGGAATYGVYHRYNKYREMMYMNQYGYGFGGGHHYNDNFGWGSRGFNNDYYNNYYLQDRCMFSCPGFSVCRYGFCECPYGYTRRYGRCSRDWGREPYRRPPKFDPLSQTCLSTEQCWDYDMNLICNLNLTTTGTGKCQCRTDMKWNSQESECQLYLDVDCSKITYDTEPDPVILQAVQDTIKRLNSTEENEEGQDLLIAGNETDSDVKNETLLAAADAKAQDRKTQLDNSLLEAIDPKKVKPDQITEAYCRDIDSLSFEFQQQEDPRRGGGGMGVGGIIGIIIPILLMIGCCCLCAICCAKKKKEGSRAPSPVAFSAVQDHEENNVQHMNMDAGPDQPGFPPATQSYQPGFPSATQSTQPGFPSATQSTQPSYAPIYPPMNQ